MDKPKEELETEIEMKVEICKLIAERIKEAEEEKRKKYDEEITLRREVNIKNSNSEKFTA